MSGERVLPFLVSETLFELDYPEDIPAIEAALKRNGDGSTVEAPLSVERHAV
jgi:hypothetical protein